MSKRKYTVQVEYLLPVWKDVVVEAESVDQACEIALQEVSDNWEGGREDYDCSTGEYVAGIAEGAHENYVDAPGSRTRAVPRRYSKEAAVRPMLSVK